MAPNIDDYLVFLRENASEIKSLGKQWGMDEEEIVSCVNEVLSRSPTTAPLNLGRRLWRSFTFLLKLWGYVFLLLALLVGAFCAAMYHGPTADYVSRTMQPHAYPIMRFFRLTALPFHDVANISHLYEAECIVDNPFFEDQEGVDCTPCSVFKTVKEAEASSFPKDKFEAYVNAAKPVLFKKTYNRNITYSDHRKLYQAHKAGFDQDTDEFVSSNPSISNLQSLLGEDQEAYLNESKSLQIRWKFTSLKTREAWESLYPRPSYMPDKAEIFLENLVLIDSPRSGTYRLPEIGSPMRVFVQSAGHRRVLLRPVELCKTECNSLLVILEAGDSLMYSGELYNLFLSTNGDDPSIAYVVPFFILEHQP